MNHDEVTAAFKFLAEPQEKLDEEMTKKLEKFVVIMYDSKTTCVSIDELRKDQFCSEGRSVCWRTTSNSLFIYAAL